MINRKKILHFFKLFIIILSIAFISYKLFTESESNNIFQAFTLIKIKKLVLLIPVVILVFINWGFESKKWQHLIKKIQHLTFNQSIQAVLAGITVSIFTPNRVGEFGGRILALERKNRIAGIFATLLGGYAQLLITLIMGTIALPIFYIKNPKLISLPINQNLLFFISIVVILVCIFVYLKIKFFARFIEKAIRDKKKRKFISFLKNYTLSELLITLLFSFFRFIVFSTQFYLLLNFFSVEIPYLQAIICISLIYFLMTIIPVISIFEFSVRGSVAVFVLSIYSNFTLGIISASFLLWIINLALPALAGSLVLYKYKL